MADIPIFNTCKKHQINLQYFLYKLMEKLNFIIVIITQKNS